MSTVGRAKGIIYIDISKVRQRLGKGGIVISLAIVKAEVFKKGDLTGGHSIDGILNLLTDAIF